MADVRVIHGEAIQGLSTLPADSVDSVVTDPPAGIEFMGKQWDNPDSYDTAFVEDGMGKGFKLPSESARNLRCTNCGGEERRRLKNPEKQCRCARPNFPRAAHRIKQRQAFVAFLTAARLLCWAIPRTSHWTGTAIENAGWIIEDICTHLFGSGFPKAKSKLKPAVEFWYLACKPSRTVPPLNIDACRITTSDNLNGGAYAKNGTPRDDGGHMERGGAGEYQQPAGRYPANLVLDEEAAALLDEQAGPQKSGGTPARRFSAKTKHAYGEFCGAENPDGIGPSAGAVSRFFYRAKAPQRERWFYCTACEAAFPQAERAAHRHGRRTDKGKEDWSHLVAHPTVKSLDLMEWLIRLVTPPGGVVLDPFAGSGSTLEAAQRAGCAAVGIEREGPYARIAEARCRPETGTLFGGVQ